MFGGGVDTDLPDHLDSDILTIPSYDRESYIEKMHPILTAKAILVLEKDTLFNEIIHAPFFQAYKDSFLVLTVSSYLNTLYLGKRLSGFRHKKVSPDAQ